ncbi:MAG: hypothetical protein AAFQ23_13545, partial [Cyanobacteria bacterium J06623_1]
NRITISYKRQIKLKKPDLFDKSGFNLILNCRQLKFLLKDVKFDLRVKQCKRDWVSPNPEKSGLTAI